MSEEKQKTFWAHTHELCPLADKLNELVPNSGSVKNPRKNPALERFRKASNAYYDVFNNGGINRGRSITHFFGPNVMDIFRQERRMQRAPWRMWERIHADTEPAMARIVQEAAVEQGVAVEGVDYV